MPETHVYRRFLMAFLLPVIFFVMLVLCLTVWQQKVTGDLTRIGRWSERDFGTRLVNHYFDVLANVETGGEPDVLVLGDSFSLPNVWQTVLAKSTGSRILSWQMNNDTCIRAWAETEIKLHPGSKTIIVESVERAFVTRGASKYGCPVDGSKLIQNSAHAVPSARSYWPLTMNLEYLGHTLLHTIQQDLRPNDEVRNETVNVPLLRNDLFSNRRADRLLYFTDDEPPWHAPAADIDATLQSFNDLAILLRAHGVRLIVLVVPDKSHVYRRAMKDTRLPEVKRNVPSMLTAAGIECPDLLPQFVDDAMRSVDFYLPDDTHLSERGFITLGDVVVHQWQSSGSLGKGQPFTSSVLVGRTP